MTTNNSSGIINVVSGSAVSYQKITAQSASSSSLIEFTGLSSTYSSYAINMDRIRPSTAAKLQCQTGIGGVYDTSVYTNVSYFLDQGAGTITTYFSTDGGATEIAISCNQSVAGSTDNEVCGYAQIIGHKNPSQVANISFQNIFVISGAGRTFATGFCRGATNNMDCIKFYFNTGTILSGTFTLYGIIA